MKVTGKITTVLAERVVKTTKGDLRKKDFILQISKPNVTDKFVHPDTIGLSLTGDQIDTISIQPDMMVTIIFDSDARVGQAGDEVFTKNRVYKIFTDEDK